MVGYFASAAKSDSFYGGKHSYVDAYSASPYGFGFCTFFCVSFTFENPDTTFADEIFGIAQKTGDIKCSIIC